jgi:hypothetical protein
MSCVCDHHFLYKVGMSEDLVQRKTQAKLLWGF